MKLINAAGNVIKDVGKNTSKAEYLKTLGYKELKDKEPKAPKETKKDKEPKAEK